MSGNDDDNTHGKGGDEGENKKKTADIIAWPGKKAEADEGGLPHDEAEDLVMKALSSITGRDPAELRRELRAREAAETEGGDRPSNVIDLDAVRAARETQHSVGGLDIGDLARAGFQAVMDELIQLQPHGGELVIDGAFVRAHGPTLIGNVLQQVGKALLARGEPRSDGAAEVDSAAESGNVSDAGAAQDGEAPEGIADTDEVTDPDPTHAPRQAGPTQPVEIRFDFGNLAMSLLSRLGIFKGAAVAEPVADPRPDSGDKPTTRDDEPTVE